MVFVPNSARISGSRATFRSACHTLDETVVVRRPGARLRGDMGIDGYFRLAGYEAVGFNRIKSFFKGEQGSLPDRLQYQRFLKRSSPKSSRLERDIVAKYEKLLKVSAQVDAMLGKLDDAREASTLKG